MYDDSKEIAKNPGGTNQNVVLVHSNNTSLYTIESLYTKIYIKIMLYKII